MMKENDEPESKQIESESPALKMPAAPLSYGKQSTDAIEEGKINPVSDVKTDADENESRDDVDFDVMLDRLELGAAQIVKEKESSELTEFEKKLARLDSLVLQS